MNFRIFIVFIISLYCVNGSELIPAAATPGLVPRSVVVPSPGIVPGVPGPFYTNLAPRFAPAIAPVPPAVHAVVPAPFAPAPFAPAAGPAVLTGYASPLGYQFPFGLQARSIHAVAPVAVPARVPALPPAPIPVAVAR